MPELNKLYRLFYAYIVYKKDERRKNERKSFLQRPIAHTSHERLLPIQWKTGNRKKAIIMKSKTTALILSILVGGLGVDRFYLGYTGMGILKLLTGGCFGILWIIDIVSIATGRLLPADGNSYDEDVAATSVPAQSASTVLEDLEKITKLHEQKVLTDEEFEK